MLWQFLADRVSLFYFLKLLFLQTVTAIFTNSFYIYKQHSFLISLLSVFYLFQLCDSRQHLTLGFIILGLDQQSSAKSKASHQFRLDQHI
jgi:hypothetical protein